MASLAKQGALSDRCGPLLSAFGLAHVKVRVAAANACGFWLCLACVYFCTECVFENDICTLEGLSLILTHLYSLIALELLSRTKISCIRIQPL